MNRPYCVHNGSSGYAFYVTNQPGQFRAATVRKDVADAVAQLLNNLPEGVPIEEVLIALRRGKPGGDLELPSDWQYGQTWAADDPRRLAHERLMNELRHGV